MASKDREDLFDFVLERVRETQKGTLDTEPQAFGRWFANTYFLAPREPYVTDGTKDGKVDLFFKTDDGSAVKYHVLNTKFTTAFNKKAPPQFYEEITYFWRAFENKDKRNEFLNKSVKHELRPRYRQLFEHYDRGSAELMFVTNHAINDGRYQLVSDIPGLKIFHMDDIIQCVVDDIDSAMPETPALTLRKISTVLPANKSETEIATWIVFARLIDFTRYMKDDPYGLLFMRNVRVHIPITQSKVNEEIRDTFAENPGEFVWSSNGITMLCDDMRHEAGEELIVQNPRVINGSQTLHSISDVSNPSDVARILVRIIKIDRPKGPTIREQIDSRKDIIKKLARRSNRQNAIKSWDLASNDDFQLELFRYFRQQGYFYERRKREWSQRNRKLKSDNLAQGPDITWLGQLIASYHWRTAKLGPALAKQSVSELFEVPIYEIIQNKTSPELAFQIFLAGSNLWECRRELAKEKKYIKNLKSYPDFALFSIVVRALELVGAKWSDPELTTQIHSQWLGDYYPHHYKKWRKLSKAALDLIVQRYKVDAARFSRQHGEELTYANYFKNRDYVSQLISAPLAGSIKRLARAALKDSV